MVSIVGGKQNVQAKVFRVIVFFNSNFTMQLQCMWIMYFWHKNTST